MSADHALEGEPDLKRFTDELAAWGSRTNLVGSTEPEALCAHVEESLSAARALPHGCRAVDLGSGAGLPGLPIAITRSDLDVTLVEIRERRVHFLRHVARTLPVRCRILRQRIEDGPESTLFDAVLMRAVAPLAESLELAVSWATPAAEIWIWTRETLAAVELLGIEGASELPLARRGRILRVPARSLEAPGGDRGRGDLGRG